MLTPEARLEIKNGGEAKIGIVKDGGAKENKLGGGKLSSGHKKLWNKFLRLTNSDARSNDLSFMKELDELIQSGGAS